MSLRKKGLIALIFVCGIIVAITLYPSKTEFYSCDITKKPQIFELILNKGDVVDIVLEYNLDFIGIFDSYLIVDWITPAGSKSSQQLRELGFDNKNKDVIYLKVESSHEKETINRRTKIKYYSVFAAKESGKYKVKIWFKVHDLGNEIPTIIHMAKVSFLK